jgi:peroxiredoxin
VAQLCQHRDELKQLDVEVLIVSFSSRGYARIWQKEVCPSFPVLLDRERTIYHTYGLERSLFRAWNLKTLWRYVQLMRAGRRWHGIQGDSIQLGGDFIVDPSGIVRLAYRSHDPADRPAVPDLLAQLQQIQADKE